jgi:hypothetical protein
MKVVLCTRFCSDAYLAKLYKTLQGFPIEESFFSYNVNYAEAKEHFYYIMINALNEKENMVQLRFSTAPRIRYMLPISQLKEHLLQLETCELPFWPAA